MVSCRRCVEGERRASSDWSVERCRHRHRRDGGRGSAGAGRARESKPHDEETDEGDWDRQWSARNLDRRCSTLIRRWEGTVDNFEIERLPSSRELLSTCCRCCRPVRRHKFKTRADERAFGSLWKFDGWCCCCCWCRLFVLLFLLPGCSRSPG